MNSRQRVLSALNHQQPDRVPIDISATRQSGIAASTYHRLKEHLGIQGPTRVFDLFQMLAEIEQPVLDRFGVDIVGISETEIAQGIRNERWKPWLLPDGTPVEVPGDFNPEKTDDGYLMLRNLEGEPYASIPMEGGFYFDRFDKFPGAAHVDPEDFKLDVITNERLDEIVAQAEAYRQNTDKAIICKAAPAQELFFGMGNGDFNGWMVTLMSEPEYVHAMYERLAENWLENLKRLYAAVGDRLDVIQFNDDLGMQDRPFIPTDMYRELIMPYYKQGCDWVHENTPWKIFMHCCGSIRPLIPSLIETGVDVLNPCQITAADMDPVDLKNEFAGKMAFWGGGCNCQQTLPFGTPEEVRAEAEHSIATLGQGGGFIFTSVHNIQANVPPENIVALFDTALGDR